ncbi:unnamed protein product [Pleuronectes platessa]|uniref:Uncharacterized protein n=1 Tax=Pleuronectes platessa TaxID=8262 RepID=A0A9N7U8B1_PLEPL|nr:unnamed protein product [Pleuronectes platessa]
MNGNRALRRTDAAQADRMTGDEEESCLIGLTRETRLMDSWFSSSVATLWFRLTRYTTALFSRGSDTGGYTERGDEFDWLQQIITAGGQGAVESGRVRIRAPDSDWVQNQNETNHQKKGVVDNPLVIGVASSSPSEGLIVWGRQGLEAKCCEPVLASRRPSGFALC